MSSQNSWSELDQDRLISRKKYNIVLVKPKQVRFHMPLFCPVCNIVMDASADSFTYDKFECCEPCANKWAFINSDTWNDGWRPSGEEIAHAVSERKPRSIGCKRD